MSGFDAGALNSESWAEVKSRQPVKVNRKIKGAITYVAHCIFKAVSTS